MADLIQNAELVLSTTETAKAVHRSVAKGELRQIGKGLYTKNRTDSDEAIIRRHIWWIVGQFFPGAIVADRTALESRPAQDGSVFIIHERATDLELPGLKVRPRKGSPGSTRQFLLSLQITEEARTLLDNLRPSRARNGVARTAGNQAVFEYLDRILKANGEDALNKLRDQARDISASLDLRDEYEQFAKIVGTLLGTQKADVPGDLAASYLKGTPYDVNRIALFEILRSELATLAPSNRPEKQTDGTALPFYEAYFSNFIEGTEFEVEDARSIIFEGYMPQQRPEDAHDIKGTFAITSDRDEMRSVPGSPAEFLAILRRRHSIIMAGRPDTDPGNFKRATNKAGTTVFVHPAQVTGTLTEGFSLYKSLTDPFARAVFMMFLVAEVHPFADGNGRCARLMMNAELVAAGQQRIIIPTVFRGEYLSSLKSLSQNDRPDALISVLDFAQHYTHAIDFSELDVAHTQLTATNAFESPMDAMGFGAKLKLPRTIRL